MNQIVGEPMLFKNLWKVSALNYEITSFFVGLTLKAKFMCKGP